jgi:hypothetical protein
MKRIVLTLAICLTAGCMNFAQQASLEAPASKDDVERYLEVTHFRDMMKQLVDVMSKQVHQMAHEQYLKHKDKLPADFEQCMTKMTEDMMKNSPIEEMLQAMIPVYQKHWTKGDVEAMVAFIRLRLARRS